MTDTQRLLVYMRQNRSRSGRLTPRQCRRAQHKLQRAMRKAS